MKLLKKLIILLILFSLTQCQSIGIYKKEIITFKTKDEFDRYAHNVFLNEKLKPQLTSNGYALLIGIDDDNYNEVLTNAEKELEQVSYIMEKSGYATQTLYNQDATYDNILFWLEHIASKSREPDSFILYYSGHGVALPEKKKGKNEFDNIKNSEISRAVLETMKKMYNDFCIVCYHPKGGVYEDEKFKVKNIIPHYEILEILKNSNFSVKIELINSCYAIGANLRLPLPSEIYNYSLQKQGYFYLCMLREKVPEGEFSSIVIEALNGNANKSGFNDDKVISIFEIVNYYNNEKNELLKQFSIRDNSIKAVIYCNEDIPVVVTN